MYDHCAILNVLIKLKKNIMFGIHNSIFKHSYQCFNP